METSPEVVATGPLMETGGVTGGTVTGGKTVIIVAFPTCDSWIEFFMDGVVDKDTAGSEAEDLTGSEAEVLAGCLAAALGVLEDALGLGVDIAGLEVEATVLAALEGFASVTEGLGVEIEVFEDNLEGSATIEDVLEGFAFLDLVSDTVLAGETTSLGGPEVDGSAGKEVVEEDLEDSGVGVLEISSLVSSAPGDF